MPKVSVCIPSYNYGQFIEGCIRSVLAQTYPDWELVIVDNRSSDNTREVVRAFQDPRIRYFENAENIGLVRNWNRCIEHARGEYVAILPADDLYLPRMLERCVRMLDSHARVGFCHTGYRRIDESGGVVETRQGWDSDRVTPGWSVLRKLVLGCYITPASVVARRACLVELGGFDERYRFELDWLMWSRIALAYDVAYVAEPLVLQRYAHAGSVTATNLAGQPRLRTAEDFRVLQEVFSRLPSTPDWREVRSEAYRMLMNRHLYRTHLLFRHGHMARFRSELAYALRKDPRTAFRYRKMMVLGAASFLGARFAGLLDSLEEASWGALNGS
jgi:hypothetical protein